VTSEWQEQAQKMMQQGRQMADGIVSSGDMVIDADPENGFFRVKLCNIDPPSAIPQITSGFCLALVNVAAMFNMRVKQHVRQAKEEMGK
jgi:hypothetical protein